ALEAAHRQGILHRDIKPDNVLEVEPGRYKVTDFGIAKWSNEAAVKTRTGIILGTPAYISPEQVLGDEPSPAGDVYALGVMLFEMISGRLPYYSKNPIQLLELHVSAPVPRLRDHAPQVPAAVDALVARALAKAQRDRFASAGDLEEALRPHLDAQEIER